MDAIEFIVAIVTVATAMIMILFGVAAIAECVGLAISSMLIGLALLYIGLVWLFSDECE